MTTTDPWPPALEGTTWRLVAVTVGSERTTVPDGVEATLRIDGERFGLRGACNRGGGEVRVDGDVLHIDGVALTRMACEPERMQLDRDLVVVLTGAPTFTVDGDRLRLVAGGRTLEFRAGG